MTERLREHGHDVQTYDPNVEARTADSLAELKEQLEAPRAFWMMIPAGEITENTFQQLLEIADEGDIDRRRRQLELPRLEAALRRGEAQAASTSSTPASRAGSGGSRSASA